MEWDHVSTQEHNEGGFELERPLGFFLTLLRKLAYLSLKREAHFTFISLTFGARIL